MKTWLVAGLIALAMVLGAFQSLPRCTGMDPDTGKAGDTIAVKGENLGKANISEVYLTDGTKDTKATIDADVKARRQPLSPGHHTMAPVKHREIRHAEPIPLTNRPTSPDSRFS